MIGMTLLVKNEIDIIKQWLDFHKDKIDFLIVTDNGSYDGTLEVLKECKEIDILLEEKGTDYQQNVWVDKMIRICKDNGCDWVVNSDADEMWHCDFRQLAKEAGENVGAIAVKCRLFVPTIWDDNNIENPVERMQYYVKSGRTKEELLCLSAWNKIMHRTEGFKEIELGNHMVRFNKPYKTAFTDECHIAHYPNRCWSQYRHKHIQGGEAYSESKLPKAYGWHWRNVYDIYFKGGIIALKKHWYSIIENRKHLLEVV